MNTLGIIAEYNPFHKGHKYSIETLKANCNADFAVVIMSGDYTQRGCPAVFDKYTRCAMALSCGADLVLELPVYYSTGSAEFFAGGAVSILNGLGCIDYLGFGSESGDILSMKQIAEVLVFEPSEFTASLKNNLKLGKSYAAARAEALKSCADIDTDIISTPNNVLGTEYIKAILLQKSNIKPICIKRQGAGYHDTSADNEYASATAIRSLMEKSDSLPASLSTYIPDEAVAVIEQKIKDKKTKLVTPDSFSELLHYKLLSEKITGFEKYLDVSREISDKIQSDLSDFNGFTDFVEKLKTKELAYTRINRALLHILLNITKSNMDLYSPDRSHFTSYARILGFKGASSALMKTIKETATIPVISRLSDAYKQLDDTQMQLLSETITASNIYDLISADCVKNEYAKAPIIL